MNVNFIEKANSSKTYLKNLKYAMNQSIFLNLNLFFPYSIFYNKLCFLLLSKSGIPKLYVNVKIVLMKMGINRHKKSRNY